MTRQLPEYTCGARGYMLASKHVWSQSQAHLVKNFGLALSVRVVGVDLQGTFLGVDGELQLGKDLALSDLHGR